MNLPRFLSFAIPGAIIVLALLGHHIASAAERRAREPQVVRGPFWIRVGIGLCVALLALTAAIYGLTNFI